MKVMKFGGTSVKDAGRIKDVAKIVTDSAASDKIVVILSALKGGTDLLINAARDAEAGKSGFDEAVRSLRTRHMETVQQLWNGAAPEPALISGLEDMFTEIHDLLRGIELIKECSLGSIDLISGFGERLSCFLFAAYLKHTGFEATYIDARTCIVTDSHFGNAHVHFEESYTRIEAAVKAATGIPIVTGYVAANRDGVSTTLGRNGSDYTASIVGAGLRASVIEIWTDVDGVLSADPRTVPDAFVIPSISFDEAMELSYFGAKVIHPFTMIPAVERNIPILIKNTMNPAAPGTWIAKEVTRHPYPITGIASIDGVALINIEGGGMVGTPGIASKIFSILAQVGVNIIMISQASSEHSICVVCRQGEADAAAEALSRELGPEQAGRIIAQVVIKKELEIVAVIGENMRGTPGISGRLFHALGEEEVNIHAIAQGSSELNISLVIESRDRDRALNVIHKAFFSEAHS